MCYVTVIDKCLRRVFEIEEVASLLEQVKDIIQRHSAEISSKVAELPSHNDNFPWTLYEMLKFFAESISWSDDMDQLVLTAKTVTEALSALVVSPQLSLNLFGLASYWPKLFVADCSGHAARRGYPLVQHAVSDHL